MKCVHADITGGPKEGEDQDTSSKIRHQLRKIQISTENFDSVPSRKMVSQCSYLGIQSNKPLSVMMFDGFHSSNDDTCQQSKYSSRLWLVRRDKRFMIKGIRTDGFDFSLLSVK